MHPPPRTAASTAPYPHLIAEVANSHGGSRLDLEALVRALAVTPYPDLGIKFQIFQPDRIALADFDYFNVYEELYLNAAEWREIIPLAARSYSVWIDIFDTYGIDVLAEHLDLVRGLKLQASVLDNLEVFRRLANLNLTGKELILNISGYPVEDIAGFLETYNTLRADIHLQIGFQRYPTAVEDTGLGKVAELARAFPGFDICFADHAEAGTEWSFDAPNLAVAAGCRLIEKHVCLDRKKAKYDHASALEPDEFAVLAEKISVTAQAMRSPFIKESEAAYLSDSMQYPVLAVDCPAGIPVGKHLLKYRRTNQKGIMQSEVDALTRAYKVLRHEISADKALEAGDFRDARIFALVAGRMKSTRLPRKALLPLNGVPSVERCLKQFLAVSELDGTVLCTSNLEADACLGDHTLDGAVGFWRGEPEDVISRFLGAAEEYGADVIVRATADCPITPPDVTSMILKSHFESGADYSAPLSYTLGTVIEVINVAAIKRVKSYFGSADYSEYMTWYFQNNPEHFELNFVDLPKSLIRDYRLTLDYPEDLEMFEALYAALPQNKEVYNSEDIFTVLDARPDIANINKHINQTYRVDPELIDKLNTYTKIK